MNRKYLERARSLGALDPEPREPPVLLSKTETLRRALNDGKPRSSAELEALTGIPQKRVIALLSWDIDNGRIERIKDEGHPMRLRKVNERSAQIERSIRFLESLGYKITQPNSKNLEGHDVR
ncbi:hypothetical protein [Marinobacter nauticus]|uniref:Uncharacterized protein n=1 Tax=Marinobacter nauticus TaxID=2743 RepID=A0A368VC55_MARNT|nr:hypothetical protein [Marinobacter nauticus]RBP76969.1 hypothetical protein DET64_101153 [Marinobacter nauticus]RCW37815.1 hypothetical protein DET51_101152 [Marinobacter nauticus]